MLRTRVITAFVLLAGLLSAVFFLPPVAWLILVALICAGASWEWGGLARFSRPQRITFAVLMAAACLLVGGASGLAEDLHEAPLPVAGFYLAGAVFWLCAVPFWLKRKWHLGNVPGAVSVGAVVLLPPALAMAHLRLVDPWLLLGAIAAVSVADIAAYFTGRALGRHKLAPEISPGKTWEGAAGAVAGVCVFGLIIAVTSKVEAIRAISLPLLFPLLVGYTVVSIQGDLFESLLKRQAGLKDSGTILPGHGGILDRIDSLTSTLPLVGLAALWLA